MGIDVAVGVGDDAGARVAAGPVAVAAEEVSRVGATSVSVSVTAQAETTKTPIAKIPTTNTARNLGIDNLYQPYASGDFWEYWVSRQYPLGLASSQGIDQHQNRFTYGVVQPPSNRR